MKEKILDWFRIIVLSPELVVVGLIVVWSIYHPPSIVKLGSALQSDSEPVKFLFGLPAALLIFSLATMKSILRPSDAVAKDLVQWHDYPKLWNRCMFSLTVLVLASVGAGGAWLFAFELSPSNLGIIFTLCCAEACVTSLTLVLAELMIRRICDDCGT